MSSLENVRQTIATFNVISPVGSEVMAELRGSYRGEGVVASSESSKLADAAEEMGMSVAHRVDRKSLGQREVRQGASANLEALARIADYYDKLPDMPREAQLKQLVDQLERFRSRMEGGGGAPSRDDVLAALGRFDGDVTHQFAALEIAREHFEAAGASAEFMAGLDAARDSFEESGVARDVRAGFAVAQLAGEAAATLETDPAAVREGYRRMLRETPNFAQLFDGLKGFDLRRNLAAVIDVFREAAGRDLASTGPSTDPAFLHQLLTELSKLKKLGSVLDLCDQLMRTAGRLVPGSQKEGIDGQSLAARLLAFASKTAAGIADARQMVAFPEAGVAARLALANGLREAHGQLPEDVVPNAQSRLQQAGTILSLLDELVEEEEREYREEAIRRKSERDGGGGGGRGGGQGQRGEKDEKAR